MGGVYTYLAVIRFVLLPITVITRASGSSCPKTKLLLCIQDGDAKSACMCNGAKRSPWLNWNYLST